jgi:hypothetical protein
MARSLLNAIRRLLTPTEVSTAKAPDKILDPVARGGSLYPIAEPDSIKGVARIDLDVVGSGEISAALYCPSCEAQLVSQADSKSPVMACPNGHGAWVEGDAFKDLRNSNR